jgi:neutral ceramidase
MVKLPILLLIFSTWSAAADYKAGVARVIITPTQPMYLSGYANRTHASEGKIHDLWAKALAIEDRKGGRVVILSTDLIGLPRGITDVVSARALKEYNLDRARLVINSSHTHSGPMIRGNLTLLFELDAEQTKRIDEYSRDLTDKLVAVIGAAISDLSPANLSFGNGISKCAMNRRQNKAASIANGATPKGPSDYDVPVLRVSAPDGKLRAVLFGYACHNTTLTGEFYQVSGDYAGFAQIDIEQANPGATALFMMLCGADQNPNPRSTLDHAKKHGADLAAEVDRVLAAPLQPVRGAIAAAFQTVDLEFAMHTRETFESRLKETNVFHVRHAKAMLATYDQGRPIRRYSYPVQAIQFGKDLTLVALGGEVVVDYALRIKKEYGSKGIIVAGYSNDVMSYIPSLRVLKEGGYEAADAMTYYGLPGPYNEEVEERIFRTMGQVMKRVKRSPVK